MPNQQPDEDSDVELHECSDKCVHSTLRSEDIHGQILEELHGVSQELSKLNQTLDEGFSKIAQSFSRMEQTLNDSFTDLEQGISQLSQAFADQNGSMGVTKIENETSKNARLLDRGGLTFHPKAQIASSISTDPYQPTSPAIILPSQTRSSQSLLPSLEQNTQETKTEVTPHTADSKDLTAQHSQVIPK